MTELLSDAIHPGTPALEELSPEAKRTLNRFALIEILVELLRRKWLIAKVTGAFILFGICLSLILPTRYTAVTEIMPPRQTPSSAALFLNSAAGMGALADLGGTGGLFRDANAIYIGLLQSRPVVDSIINKFDLNKVYRTNRLSDARKVLQQNTSIASERSTLLSISVTDRDKNRAADIANAFVDELRVLSNSISITEASRRRVFFEDQLKTQKESLITAEADFQKVQQNKGLVRLDVQANLILSRLATLRSEIAAKEVDLQALQSFGTEENPAVRVAERELSAMREEAAQLEQHSDSSGSSDLGLKDVPKAGLDYIRAQRELAYQQSLFDLLLKQYEAARLDESKDAAVIQVVEPAIAPDRRTSPKRTMIVILCAFLGFVSGIILVLFLHWRTLMLSDPESASAIRNLKNAFVGKAT